MWCTGSLFAPSRLFLISDQHDPCCSKCTIQIDNVMWFVLPRSLLASNELLIQPSDFLLLFPLCLWVPRSLQMYFLLMFQAKSPHSSRLPYRFFLSLYSTVKVAVSPPAGHFLHPQGNFCAPGVWWGQVPGSQPLPMCWDNWFGEDSRAWSSPPQFTYKTQAGPMQGMGAAPSGLPGQRKP